MNSKNWIIAALIVIVIALGYFMFKDKSDTNQAANTQTQTPTPPPAPNPVPSELPTPSPEPTPAPNPAPSSFKETFAEYNWLIDTITVDGQPVDMNVNVPAAMTLNFDMSKKGYSGFSGCNSYSGTYTASAPDNFLFGKTVTTKMACVDSSGLEGDLLEAMSKVSKFKIQNGTLILTSTDGKTKITYKLAV